MILTFFSLRGSKNARTDF